MRIFTAQVALLLLTAPLRAESLEEARALWLKGNYGEAVEHYEKLSGPAAALGKARCLMAVSKYAAAGEVLDPALKQHPGDADLLAQRAHLDLFRGEYAQGLDRADQAIKLDEHCVLARWVKARALTLVGKNEEANGHLEWFINYYNDAQPADAEELLYIAMAAAEYARWNRYPDEFDFILNDLLVDAADADPDDWRPHWYSGVLLVEKYNKAEGVPALKNALQKNPSAVLALVGLGVASLQGHDIPEGHVYADQALKVAPENANALRLKADLLLADSKTDEAVEQLEQALKINPKSEKTMGRLAACRHLQGRSKEVEDLEVRAHAINPKPGAFYFALAHQLESRRQFTAAEKMFRQAVENAPHLASPLNGLGMLLMRIGKEDEARQVFAKARELDPFHVRVLNMVKVLRHMEGYESIKSPHYEVVVDPGQDRLLGRYMSDYLESEHERLCRRFGYEPGAAVKIEVMRNHQWFSGRVIGLPNVGTVGACTGDVVALASPQSLRTPYNWARVLTHEVTHVITLQQTGYNIPHWFTEALAVQAEGYPRPQVWNELLARRVPKGDLLTLDNINHTFVRPKTPLDWQMAYCQSLLYAEYMLKAFGDDALARLLRAYGEGKETPQAVQSTFKVTVEEFEKGYREYLDNLVKDLKVDGEGEELSFAEAEKAFRADPENPDVAARLAVHHHRRRNNARARELAEKALELMPNHPKALYVLARMELSIGKSDEARVIIGRGFDFDDPDLELLDLLAAIEKRDKNFQQAARLYELAQKRDPLNKKWVEGLAQVYLNQKNDEKLAEVLATLARMDADNLAVRKKLAQLASEAKDWKEAEKWARQTLYVDVSDLMGHRILGDAAFEQGQYQTAVREYELVQKQKPDEEVAARLAEAREKLKKRRKAKG